MIGISRARNLLPRFYLPLAFILGFIQLFLKTRGEYISPWDEMYHFSYVQYIYDGHIPRQGDVLNTWARHGFSCYPVWPFGMTTSIPCGEMAAPNFYPEGGTNTAAIWPPIYYAVVAFLLHLVVPFGYDPLIFARLITVAIWTLGVVLIAYAVSRIGASKHMAFGLVLLLCSLPFATFHGAFITPHSMIPLLISGFLFLMKPVITGEFYSLRRSIMVSLYSIIVVMTVPHAISAVAIFSGSLMINQILRMKNIRPISARLSELAYEVPKLIISVLPIMAAFATNKIWNQLQSIRAVEWQDTVNSSASQAAQPISDPALTPAQYLEAIWRFFPHTVDSFQFQGTLSTAISQYWMYFLVAGVCGTILYSKNFELQIAAILTIFSGVLFSIYLERTILVAIAPRYGLSIVLVGFAIAVVNVRGKLPIILFLLSVIGTYGATLSSIPFKS